MTETLINISKLSDKEMVKVLKGNMSFKVRFMFVLIGLFGPIFPAWTMLMLIKTYSSLMIDCTDTDDEVIRAMYILGGKVKR
jgi:hypothetical protein